MNARPGRVRVALVSLLAAGLAFLALLYGATALLGRRFAPLDDPVNHARVTTPRGDHPLLSEPFASEGAHLAVDSSS